MTVVPVETVTSVQEGDPNKNRLVQTSRFLFAGFQYDRCRFKIQTKAGAAGPIWIGFADRSECDILKIYKGNGGLRDEPVKQFDSIV